MGVLADWGATGQSPSSFTSASASAVYFSRPIYTPSLNTSGPGGVGYAFPGITSSVTPSASNATGQLVLPGSQYPPAAAGTRLRMVASGTVTTYASYGVTVTVQLNTGTLATPSYTTFAATGTNTDGAAGTFPWFLEAHFVIGSAASVPTAPNITGVYFGSWTSNTTPTLIDLTAITAPSNAVVMGSAGLVVNVLFGTGHAGNGASMSEFSILGD